MEKLTKNSKKDKNSNLELFYKYKGKESHFVLFIYKYQLVDIQYIQNIQKISSS